MYIFGYNTWIRSVFSNLEMAPGNQIFFSLYMISKFKKPIKIFFFVCVVILVGSGNPELTYKSHKVAKYIVEKWLSVLTKKCLKKKERKKSVLVETLSSVSVMT